MVYVRDKLLVGTMLVLASLSTTGCTTTMTSMTDARAYEPGEVQVAANYQATAHSNVLGGVIRGVGSAVEEFGADSKEPISEEAFRDWLDVVLLAAMFRPTTSPEVIARVGVTDRVLEGLDIGFRTNLSIFKGDAKLQFWENERGDQALSIMAGYAYHRSWLNEWIEWISLTEFKRSDIDLQMLWGINVRDILKVSVGPHVILSRVSAEHKLDSALLDRLPESVRRYDPNRLFDDEWIGYYGANSSIMLGYKYAFVALDLGVFWMDFRPDVVGEQRDYSGVALSLAGGLSLHYDF